MDHFNYRDGHLYCEDVPVVHIADAIGTPVYIYSASTFVEHYQRLTEAFAALNPTICYSVKSCSNLAIIGLLAKLGAGADVVSGGELYRAELAGIPGDKIVYAGVGKTDDEIRRALAYSPPQSMSSSGIRLFNVESEAEFENIASIARSMGVEAEATLRINPDVDPETHEYTTTGLKETKFGVDLERAKAFFNTYGRDSHLKLTALHLHIGSPVYSPEPYVEALQRSLQLIDELEQQGYHITALNLGGGFGADYESGQSPTAKDYAERLVPMLADRVAAGLQIIFEPGRTIAANAGILLARVQYLKSSGTKQFVIVDAGMHTLIRPALYSAFHFVWPAAVVPQFIPVERREDMQLEGLVECDVVGPICESGDFLAKDRQLPPVQRGDLMAVFTAGAYGSVMANRYNSHPLPAEVLVQGTDVTVIRRRESQADLVEHELHPERLAL